MDKVVLHFERIFPRKFGANVVRPAQYDDFRRALHVLCLLYGNMGPDEASTLVQLVLGWVVTVSLRFPQGTESSVSGTSAVCVCIGLRLPRREHNANGGIAVRQSNLQRTRSLTLQRAGF